MIIFNGVRYRRYASSPYFTPGIADRRNGARRLHEDIWRSAHGDVPSGHDIHHIDGNALNNDLANLQCLPFSEHQAIHTQWRQESGSYRTAERLAHLDEIRPLAAAWHSTPEGQAWHSATGVASWKGREPDTYACGQCGSSFQSRKPGSVKYCSNNCRAAARRASGVDNEDRQCAGCGSTFSVNRYQVARFCSRKCRYV